MPGGTGEIREVVDECLYGRGFLATFKSRLNPAVLPVGVKLADEEPAPTG